MRCAIFLFICIFIAATHQDETSQKAREGRKRIELSKASKENFQIQDEVKLVRKRREYLIHIGENRSGTRGSKIGKRKNKKPKYNKEGRISRVPLMSIF
jgi:hypothetical protein